MSTSPDSSLERSARAFPARLARIALVVASVVVVASATSAVADLNADNPTTTSTVTTLVGTNEAVGEADATPRIIEAAPARRAQLPPTEDCAGFPGDVCSEVPIVTAAPAEITLDLVPSCVLDADHDPQGATSVVPGSADTDVPGPAVRFRVEVEDGLAIDPSCFAAAVTTILTDERGWTGTGTIHFERVEDDSYDFRLILASPETTDTLCHPAATAGIYSCRNQDRVVLNLMRWETGADEFNGDLDTYRQYLVNHEVGHLLGHGHRSCPAPGTAAPVMMQQTKGVGECLPNGWPTADER